MKKIDYILLVLAFIVIILLFKCLPNDLHTYTFEDKVSGCEYIVKDYTAKQAKRQAYKMAYEDSYLVLVNEKY